MLTFLIPTAKEMTLDKATLPHHLDDQSSIIIQEMANSSTDELVKRYKIKESAAQVEYERWQKLQTGQALACPALHLFNGLMYRNIKRDLSTEEQAYLDKSVYITSALYGIIPAMQPIAPHRLDFNTKLKIDGQSLKAYWREDYDRFIRSDMTIISLLSSEFEDVFSPAVRQSFIRLSFMEEKGGQLKTHSTISKKARGNFLTQAVEKQVKTVNELKGLSFDSFNFNEKFSSEHKLVYVKKI